MGIGIIFNNTNNGYVINSATSVWNTNSKDYYIITIILTPNIAIRYCKKNSIKKILGLDNDYFINIINDDDIILNENINTLKATYNNNPNFVVGRKKDLEILINNYQKN